jgi:hypothetical protein
MNAVLSADYRITRHSSIEMGYERENWSRPYREREKTGEDRVRLAYVNRDFSAGTLRVSYEYGHRRGGEFVAAPLADFYSASLGPVPQANGTNMTTWVRNGPVPSLRRGRSRSEHRQPPLQPRHRLDDRRDVGLR